MEKLWISERHVDTDRGERYHEARPYETSTADPGELFASLRREFGGCIEYSYEDTPDGSVACGWGFGRRVPYDDADPSLPRERRTFWRQVWVTLHAPDGAPLPLDAARAAWRKARMLEAPTEPQPQPQPQIHEVQLAIVEVWLDESGKEDCREVIHTLPGEAMAAALIDLGEYRRGEPDSHYRLVRLTTYEEDIDA